MGGRVIEREDSSLTRQGPCTEGPHLRTGGACRAVLTGRVIEREDSSLTRQGPCTAGLRLRTGGACRAVLTGRCIEREDSSLTRQGPCTEGLQLRTGGACRADTFASEQRLRTSSHVCSRGLWGHDVQYRQGVE